ncbi:helix-turn-helix transcriptional regulator [Dyella sp. OK004]|uniref:helix-turn-helix domain-containing protein n=1 Tax=Dyella sp. OK004 TaxID=1855292 RepID=UPI0015A5EDAF|nr:helix-turn-helix transcriptional regulator [Dyella sp. OK004]
MKKGRSRTSELAAVFDVSRETARKWLNDLAMPEMERMTEMAGRFGVSFEWLATGRGAPKGFHMVQDATVPYRVENREQARLIGLVGRLPRDQRKALLVLLEQLVDKS